jgi:hypothetical protein
MLDGRIGMRAIKLALTASGLAGIFIVLVLSSALLTAAVATQLSSRMASPIARS